MKTDDIVETEFGVGKIVKIEMIYNKKHCGVKSDAKAFESYTDKTMYFFESELKKLEKL